MTYSSALFKRSPSKNLLHFLYFVIGLTVGLTAAVQLRGFSINLGVPLPSVWQSLPQPEQLGQAVKLSSNVSSPQQGDVGIFMHRMEDEELFKQASMAHTRNEISSKFLPKVAFMFLTKGPIPLAPLWQKFFQGHEGMYSIYVHSDPLYEDRVGNDSVFYGRRVFSKKVQWGKPSMIQAERRLLANALLDFSNQRLVLLSESCIPLFNFSTIYAYLTNTNESFVHTYDDPRKIGRGRYNHLMSPTLNITQWRKGSQWFEVSRKTAITIVSDEKYFPLFTEHCYPPCYTDEHYIPTLVNVFFPEDNIHRSITWVDWSKNGPHPGRFIRKDVTLEFLNKIRFSENCTYNGNTSSICVLFARKFVGDTLQPLLDLSSLLFS
ncbi:hypothetical protein Leryth_002987 [Lithospermum erythrorhizon]|nr:hypothetical protein Leryth_002987 [Lithospermum erythrorhizon]